MRWEPMPDYADVMTLADFIDNVGMGVLTNDDGTGYYATATHVSNVLCLPSNVNLEGIAPAGATHVAWFNK